MFEIQIQPQKLCISWQKEGIDEDNKIKILGFLY